LENTICLKKSGSSGDDAFPFDTGPVESSSKFQGRFPSTMEDPAEKGNIACQQKQISGKMKQYANNIQKAIAMIYAW